MNLFRFGILASDVIVGSGVQDSGVAVNDDVRYFKHGWDCGYPTGWRAAERWHGVSPADAAVVSEGCGAEESAV